tara:strand:+ start:144164 stop:144697 length:534 start_codon:yes stop_codon:yes gene_type:complete
MKNKQNKVLKLIEKFKNGEEKAFDEIVKLHYEPTFNLLFKLVGNKLDADDLCQETFIRVYRYVKKFKGNSKFSTWLYRIAYNVANTYFRKQKIKQIFSFDLNQEILLSKDPVEDDEMNSILMKNINLLPKKQKAILMFRVIEGLPYKEISKIMNISINAAKVNYHHAISSLKKKISN